MIYNTEPPEEVVTPRHDGLKGWILNSKFTRDPIIPPRFHIRLYYQLIVLVFVSEVALLGT